MVLVNLIIARDRFPRRLFLFGQMPDPPMIDSTEQRGHRRRFGQDNPIATEIRQVPDMQT